MRTLRRRAVRSGTQRGYTMIELIVASTIALLAIGMGMMGFNAQNQALQALEMARSGNNSARDALLQLETTLRRAGWGIAPYLAVDMRRDCINPVPPAPCRDQINAPDELAFIARNPNYAWRDRGENGCMDNGGCFDKGNAWKILSNSGTSFQLTLPEGALIEMGRLLLAACANPFSGAPNQVIVRATARVANPGPGPLTMTVPYSATPGPYNLEGANGGTGFQGCHYSPDTALFLIDRYRYYVSNIVVAGITTPWLMLDTGMDVNADNVIDQSDHIPVAKNVEDLQVAYAYTANAAYAAPDLSDFNWVVGDVPGVAEEPSFAMTPPYYPTPINDPTRFNRNPANIRGVRVSLVIRSERQDTTRPPSWTGDVIAGFENRNVPLTGGRFRRYVARSEVTLRNMSARSPFIF